MCSKLLWNTRFRTNRESFNGTAKHRTLTQYNIFTDGSQIGTRTGAGYIIYKGKNPLHTGSDRLPDHATVFQAEITAVSKAAEALMALQKNNVKYVKFFVDSQAALLALSNPTVRNRTVNHAIETLNKLADRTTRVTLCWIPAHRGHFGNCEADDLAKEGTIKPDITAPVGQPTATIKTRIRQYIANLWRTDWDNYNLGSHTKLFYASPNPTKARVTYGLSRPDLGRIVRITTGHNNLNGFQFRIGLADTPDCRFCGEDRETIMHYIEDCPRLLSISREIFLDQAPRPDMQWKVRQLLRFSRASPISEALDGSHFSDNPSATPNHTTPQMHTPTAPADTTADDPPAPD